MENDDRVYFVLKNSKICAEGMVSLKCNSEKIKGKFSEQKVLNTCHKKYWKWVQREQR